MHRLAYMLSYSRNYEVGSMGIGAGLYMYDDVERFTFTVSSPDEFLLQRLVTLSAFFYICAFVFVTLLCNVCHFGRLHIYGFFVKL